MKFDGWPWKTIGHLSYPTSSFVHHFIAIGEFDLELQSGNAQSGSNWTILRAGDLESWRMTLQNNRAPLLSIIKLYASFHHHMSIQTGVTVRKRLSWVVTSVTLTFDLWPWPFAWTLLWSLVITPKLVILLKLDLNHRFFSPCDLEIWWMTQKNNRAPLLCYFKLCAAFRSHWWIQIGVRVRKRPIWVKFDAF